MSNIAAHPSQVLPQQGNVERTIDDPVEHLNEVHPLLEQDHAHGDPRAAPLDRRTDR
jgi:hypothetical protein